MESDGRCWLQVIPGLLRLLPKLDYPREGLPALLLRTGAGNNADSVKRVGRGADVFCIRSYSTVYQLLLS